MGPSRKRLEDLTAQGVGKSGTGQGKPVVAGNPSPVLVVSSIYILLYK
jgi:hypothetical protein